MVDLEPPPHAAIQAALMLGGVKAAQRIFRAHVNRQRNLTPDEKKEWVRGRLRQAMERYVQEGVRRDHLPPIAAERISSIIEEFERWSGRRL